jgi:6-phosphogluconolactonase
MTRTLRLGRIGDGAMSALTLLAAIHTAAAQSDTRAIFVSNNGNLEGSVTAFRVNDNGAVTFVNRIVTGTRTQLTQPCSGCNAIAISITPNGRYLVSSHATGDPPLHADGLTVFEVAADASISQVLHFQLHNLPSPLDVQWLDNQHLAVTRTSAPSNGVAVYRLNLKAPGGPTLNLIDTEIAGGFSTGLALHPGGQYLYLNNSSGGNGLFIFSVNANGTLTAAGFLSSGTTYTLGPGISPDGRWIYGGGGISSGSHAVFGASIDPASGALTTIVGSPFFSPGNSPKQVAVSPDGAMAFAAHGSDSSVRSFMLDPKTGALTATGFSFAVGIQGSLGEVATLDDLLFATDRDTINDGVRGLISRTVSADGSMTPNGPTVDTQGIAPNGIAVWGPPPPNPADLNQDGVVNGLDLGLLLLLWNHEGSTVADLNGDMIVNGLDLGILLINWTI